MTHAAGHLGAQRLYVYLLNLAQRYFFCVSLCMARWHRKRIKTTGVLLLTDRGLGRHC